MKRDFVRFLWVPALLVAFTFVPSLAVADTSACALTNVNTGPPINSPAPTETCTLVEGPGEVIADEVSRANSVFHDDLKPGFVVLTEPGDSTLSGISDIIWFVPTSVDLAGEAVSGEIAMFSDGSFLQVLDGTLFDSQSGLTSPTIGAILADSSTVFLTENTVPQIFNRASVASANNGTVFIDQYHAFSDVVPEPATLSLMGLGLLAVARRLRRKK